MIYQAAQATLVLVAILIFGISAEFLAAEGDLDPTFGNSGVVITDGGRESERIYDLAIQQDGKIVAVGFSRDFSVSTNNAVVLRYNSDGSLDSSFGASGMVSIPSTSFSLPIKLALQSDGKIVVASGKEQDFFVARLNSDGSFDTDFNGTGTVNFDLRGTNDIVNSVNIQTDGKILVGGSSHKPASTSDSDFAIIRLNPNGVLDTTFDSDGKVFTTLQDTAGISDLTVQTDGKIVAVGESTLRDIPNNNSFGLFVTVRYNSDGSIDSGFNGNGTAFADFTINPPGVTRSNMPTKVLLREGEKILVVGTTSSREIIQIAMIQYNLDGSVDTSFGNQGRVQTGLTGFSMTVARDAAIQPDNKIVIGGTYQPNIKDPSSPLIGRFTAEGSLDPTINGTGWKRLEFPSGNSGAGFALAIQPDGKTLLGGLFRVSNSVSDFFVARFLTTDCQINCAIPGSINVFDFDGDGRTDASVFRNDTWFIQPSSANNPNTFYTVALGLPDDKLVPADYDGDGKTDVAVWRENVSGNQSFFYIIRSSNNTLFTYQFGNTGDDPGVVDDWDGDGRADLAVYRQAASAGEQSLYYYIPSSAANPFYVVIPWGTSEDKAISGDFDGDGKSDAAVFRPSNGVWYVLQSSDNQPSYTQWGIATDKRVSGDFDGDGKTDFVVYRDGVWYVLQSTNNEARYVYWGISTDSVVAGDYDGDGLTDYAVWRDGVYYIQNNASSQVTYQQFGITGDVPVASAFNR